MKTRIENYIDKTSVHLFRGGESKDKLSEYYFKVFRVDDNIIKLQFTDAGNYKVSKISISKMISYHGNDTLNVIQHTIFHPENYHESVKHRKVHRELFEATKIKELS